MGRFLKKYGPWLSGAAAGAANGLFGAGGGMVLLTVYAMERRTHSSVWRRCLRSAGIITLYEFAVGCLVNLRLGWNVWDYSARPGNLLGQICPLFCFLWLLLSGPVLLLCGWLRHNMEPELPRQRHGICWR